MAVRYFACLWELMTWSSMQLASSFRERLCLRRQMRKKIKVETYLHRPCRTKVKVWGSCLWLFSLLDNKLSPSVLQMALYPFPNTSHLHIFCYIIFCYKSSPDHGFSPDLSWFVPKNCRFFFFGLLRDLRIFLEMLSIFLPEPYFPGFLGNKPGASFHEALGHKLCKAFLYIYKISLVIH